MTVLKGGANRTKYTHSVCVPSIRRATRRERAIRPSPVVEFPSALEHAGAGVILRRAATPTDTSNSRPRAVGAGGRAGAGFGGSRSLVHRFFNRL
jgi:hypothetical protein